LAINVQQLTNNQRKVLINSKHSKLAQR